MDDLENKTTEKLNEMYGKMFGDNLGNMLLSEKREREMLIKCLRAGEDVYEIGSII